MSGGIFLVQDDGQLLELSEQRYKAESVLQGLLADYPNLIVGNQINPSSPRRWLFITQELAIPGDSGGIGRWSLDHLFLDQDAIPTLIEVKRSTDPRARREVVAQMLDYAANAVSYLNAAVIRSRFEISCIERGKVAEDVISSFIEPGEEEEVFWQTVDLNLKTGHIRMLFVADEIPPELQRIVEFLNQQMNPAEVMAIEIRQFVGNQTRALVPRVLGQTITAQEAKTTTGTPSTKRKWDEQAFFEKLAQRENPQEVTIAQGIYDWVNRNGMGVRWGEGVMDGSFFPILEAAGTVWIFGVWTYGRVEMQFQYMPREREDLRRELRRRLNEIPGVNIPLDAITKRPSIKLELLAAPEAIGVFLATMTWVVDELSKQDEHSDQDIDSPALLDR